MADAAGAAMSRQRGVPTLRFLGGAGTVTGSKFLVQSGGGVLLLECGLFQGLKELRLRNWRPPPLSVEKIDAVVLSHAHIDHSGYVPLLVRNGYRGPVYCTSGTADLLRVLWPDAAYLQEEEAENANRYGYSKHKPALPLYTKKDADAALRLLAAQPYGQSFDSGTGAGVTFRRAGHILGSATVELALHDDHVTLVHSGDLGRWDRPILRDPEPVDAADVLLVESTYGGRVHAADADAELVRVVCEAEKRGGALIVPSFAVGRAQELIWRLRRLEDDGRIPDLPVFLDSPMAIDVTDIYCRHPEDHDLDMRELTDRERCPLCCRQHRLVRTAAESKGLNDRRGAFIVIAGSGMVTGGRVLHHLEARLPDERTTVLLPGFQAAGTRGRSLQDGARTLRMHGREIPVRAHVEVLDGLSAHADQNDMLRWLGGFRRAPRQVYVVHGEPAAATALATAIRERLRWPVAVAEDGATAKLSRS